MESVFVGDFRFDRVVESENLYAPLNYLLPGIPADLVKRNSDWLKPHYVNEEGTRPIMAFQSFILRTRWHTVLIDTCTGNDKERPQRLEWHRQNNDFLERMKRAGVHSEDVDFVFCTHLHADHVGWNTRLQNGRWTPTFPRAKYLFARREYEYWERAHNDAVKNGHELPNHGSYADSVLPVMQAGQVILVDTDHQIEDGVHLEAAHGHTPGACFMHAKSRGDHAVLIGDAMHTPVQLAMPSLSSRFAFDPAESAKTRIAMCERYAETNTIILAAHFPTPVAARIRRNSDAFRIDTDC